MGSNICLCGAGLCNTPEARELRAELEHREERQRQLRRRAFELYCADRDASRAVRSADEYLLIAIGDLDGAETPELQSEEEPMSVETIRRRIGAES